VEVSPTAPTHDEGPESDDETDGKDKQDVHGRVLSDNVFGTQTEDAVRRDFTVNALFYDPVKEEVWDFQHGVKDLVARKLVMIGDPATRYREDPVRMLRAARLSAKLGLTIDPKTAAPSPAEAPPRERPAGAPLREILKMLLSGNAVACVSRLRELELHHGLLPLLDDALEDPATGPFAMAALKATDDRLREDKPVSPRSCWPPSCGAAWSGAGTSSRRRGSRRRRRCIRRCTTRWTRSVGRLPSRAASTPR